MSVFRVEAHGDRSLVDVRHDFIRARALHAAGGSAGPATVVAEHLSESSVDLAMIMGIEAVSEIDAGQPVQDLKSAWQEGGLTVGVIIASHNYRDFLPEAVDSLLRQTYRPDQILISDDASTDGSAELIRERYAELPGVEVRLGGRNLGIEAHFNEAIALLASDVVIILGADNRLPPHYVQRCLEALVADPSLGIAYTDFAYFGSLAGEAHARLPEDFRGPALSDSVYLSDFPVFGLSARETLFAGRNFIHGSSAYRRAAFVEVEGYGSRAGGPEDWGLFKRILMAGHGAVKVEDCYLEYRQHSDDQANLQFAYHWELGKLRDDVRALREGIDYTARLLDEARAQGLELESEVRTALIEVDETRLRLREVTDSRDALVLERDTLVLERNALVAERDALLTEFHNALEDLAAHRAALEKYRSSVVVRVLRPIVRLVRRTVSVVRGGRRDLDI